MKITGAETYLVENTPPYTSGRVWLFVKLTTDEGIEGAGEWITGQSGREEIQIKTVETLARRFLIGSDPFRVESHTTPRLRPLKRQGPLQPRWLRKGTQPSSSILSHP